MNTFEPATIAALHATMVHAIAKHGWAQTPLNPARKDVDNLPILVEEIGEVARAMTYDEGSRDALIKELLQTAAMALSWAEAVDIRIEADRNRQEATGILEDIHREAAMSDYLKNRDDVGRNPYE
jgi:NTP pyrophosphatase (non-canonical NTP hydrolase)